MSILDRFTNLFTKAQRTQTFGVWTPLFFKSKNMQQMLYEYKNIVYSAVNAIAVETGKYQPIVQRKDKSGKYTTIDHPFQKLLKRPNSRMSNSDLFFATEAYLKLTGNAFWYFALGEISGLPKSITVVRPDRVKIVVDETRGEVTGYTIIRPDGSEIPIEVREMLHFRAFNPRDDYWGMGAIEAGALYIDMENSTSEFQLSYMQNQATPSGVMSFKGDKVITAETFQKIKTAWKENSAGTGNAGKTLFINEAEVTFTKLGLDLSDLDMSALKGMTKEDVLELFRVPEALLGKTDSSGLGRANVEAIEYIFTSHVIEPELIRFDDMIEMAIMRFWPKDSDINVTHVSQIPEDREAKLLEREAGVDKWITRNEIRLEEGRVTVDGADALYYNFSQLPLEAANSRAAEVTNSFGKAIIKLKADSVVKTATENYYSRLDSLEATTVKKYAPRLKKLLSQQENDVLDQVKTLAGGTKKQFVEAIGTFFTLTFTDADVEATFLPVLLAAYESAVEMGIDFANPEIDIDFILEQATRDAVFASTQRQLKSFNEETALKIQQQLAQGLSNKEDVSQLTKRIESIYEDAKGYRATRIAQTEAHNAVNEGVANAYLQSGYNGAEWEAQPSACQFCRAMNGKTVIIGKPFLPQGSRVEGLDGGVYEADYTDVSYANLHPGCNCKLKPRRIE